VKSKTVTLPREIDPSGRTFTAMAPTEIHQAMEASLRGIEPGGGSRIDRFIQASPMEQTAMVLLILKDFVVPEERDAYEAHVYACLEPLYPEEAKGRSMPQRRSMLQLIEQPWFQSWLSEVREVEGSLATITHMFVAGSTGHPVPEA